jgi:hypothetical protein
MHPDFKGRQFEILLTEDANWQLFEKFGQVIILDFGGKIIVRLDGLDERYWDFRIGELILTLHLQHYLGIFLFPAAGFENSSSAKDLTENVAKRLRHTIVTN